MAVADSKAEYYNMQGHRLNNLQKGINIVKRNGKTMKQKEYIKPEIQVLKAELSAILAAVSGISKAKEEDYKSLGGEEELWAD